MNRKGKRGFSNTSIQGKRRKFKGNKYSFEEEASFASTSAEKLRNKGSIEVPISKEFGYCILNFFAVFSTISSCVICKICQSEVNFHQTQSRGLGFKILMQCKCGEQLINTSPFIGNAYEINRRIVVVMRLLGLGREGTNLFCGLMDISQGLAINTYYQCLENIYYAASAVYDCVIKRAVEEEEEKNAEVGNPKNLLTVFGNGMWKKEEFLP